MSEYSYQRPYSFVPVEGTDYDRRASTTETFYSAISRIKDPVIAMFSYNHGAARQEFDRTLDPIFAPIATELYLAPTEREFETKKELYLKDLADRKVYANSTWAQIGFSELANPFGYLMPVTRIGQGTRLVDTAMDFALTAGSFQVAEEAIRYSQMPNYNPVEGVFNIGATVLLGGAFGGVAYGGKAAINNMMDSAHRRLGQHQQSILEMENFAERQEILREMVQAKRPLGERSDQNLRIDSISLSNRISGKSATIERIQKGELNLSDQAVESIQNEVAGLIAQRQQVLDEINMRRLDQGLYTVDDPWGVSSSFFDWIDIMPTPTKTIARFKLKEGASEKAKLALNNFKKSSLMLAGDSSILYAGQRLGLTLPPSVHIQNQLRKSEIYSVENELVRLWKEDTDAPRIGAPNVIRSLTGSKATLDDWINEVNAKRIRQDTQLTEKQAEAAEVLNRYWSKIRDEAKEYGTIGDTNFIETRMLVARASLDEGRTKLDEARLKKQASRTEYWENRVKELEDNVAELENSLEFVRSTYIRPSGPEEPYFMRQWDVDAITRDEKGPKLLRQELTNWVRENPYGVEYNNKTGLHEMRDLTGNIPAQDAYVNTVIRSILTDNDPAGSSLARSTKYPSRSIAIPNSQVLDFINTDTREVMRSYNMRMASKIDFAKTFGNRSYKEVVDELVDDLVDSGVSLKDANMLRRNMTTLYKRVTATTLTDPTSLSNRSVQFLKEFTSLNYLGGAGVTTIGDVPKIIMENGFKNSFRGLLSTFESSAWQNQLKEVRTVYSEALELGLGTTQQRLIEDTGSQVGSRVWTKVKDAGFVLNGLGPATVGLKSFAGGLSVHRFLEIAGRVADGSASRFDLEYMGRYNLTSKQMKEIVSKAPTEETGNGLKVANITEWEKAGVSTETILAFRAAVSQNVGNTILSSTPATRFTYADGSVFLSIDKARKFIPSIKEDPDFPGYARWESSVMTLPFQFYNFSMSAYSNILHTAAQGQTKSRYMGFATMIGMGYLLAKLKTPEWAWDDMDYDERFMAAVERSGIAAIYGDIALNSIRTATQLGLNDPENDFIQLPFYGREGYAEAMTTVLGAGSSTIKDGVDATIKLSNGDYQEALRDFYLMLPLTELFWLKEDSRAMIDYASKSIFENR